MNKYQLLKQLLLHNKMEPLIAFLKSRQELTSIALQFPDSMLDDSFDICFDL